MALSKYERGNGAKKRELFVVSKVEFNFKISSVIKTLSVDPVFSIWVNVIKKCVHCVHYSFQVFGCLYF